jgi:tetratricopeptide (TPR) repeat protein
MEQIFALAPDCDATQLNLTAAQGYLLSRIDGATPWRLVREIGGLPADEADACLERWVEDGLLAVVGSTSGAGREAGADDGGSKPGARAKPTGSTKRAADSTTDSTQRAADSTTDSTQRAAGATSAGADAAEAPPGAGSTIRIDESLIDEGLDIDIDVQRRILEFEACLGWPYHQLLGVPKGAEPKVVKRAYFKLSKEFHPDRYFRKQIGHHGERLERIFKKVLEAHEMLSDPELRDVENQTQTTPESVPEAAASAAASAASEASGAAAGPRPLTKLERLRQRMPFKIDHAALAARREKARQIFQAAAISQKAGRLSEAEASIRIAISFDPGCAEFKEALGAIRIEAAGARATKLLAAPSERMSDGELRDALKLLEDVLMYRPHDPQLNERAAQVSMQLGHVEAAQGYVETLIERTPEVARYHTLLGRILRERGETNDAVAAYETALKLDEDDAEARRSLASIRLGARKGARGGT